MRFLIAACGEHPERQRALFIMSYIKLMEEMDFYVPKENLDAMLGVLKEIHKHLRTMQGLKVHNLTVFTLQDASTLIDRLAQYAEMFRKSISDRKAKIATLAKKLDEEDLEYFEEDIERVSRGLHHIMEICGCVLANMGQSPDGAAVCQAVSAKLLPGYAQVLLAFQEKKEYDIIDSVCFLCDCLEHGSDEMFGQVHG